MQAYCGTRRAQKAALACSALNSVCSPEYLLLLLPAALVWQQGAQGQQRQVRAGRYPNRTCGTVTMP